MQQLVLSVALVDATVFLVDGQVLRLGSTMDSERFASDAVAAPGATSQEPRRALGTRRPGVDPALLWVGEAVAARRRELGLPQRTLARDKVINAGTLIELEKGRRWPRANTRARLERALGWAPGTIERLRTGSTPAPGVDAGFATVGSPAAMEAECLSRAVQLALGAIGDIVADLPAPTAPDFAARASAVLSDLRRLEVVASYAVRAAHATSPRGRPSGEARRTH
jgi:DNA-binding XRE family transcriptional regulator